MQPTSLSVDDLRLKADNRRATKQGGLKGMSKILGGSLLVAGTCIGAGMLGLPVSTAAGGFYWSTSFFLVVWALMTLTAFLMLEVSLWHDEDTNLVSMMRETLGRGGEIGAWITYILFLYSIMAAYTAGGSAICASFLSTYGVPSQLSGILFIGFFGFVVYHGASWVDMVNRGFMLGLILTYIGLVAIGTSEVDVSLFADGKSKYLWAALPLMVTSFGFHLLIPSLKTYFNNDIKKLRYAIFFGSLIPLLVYLLWEFIILGIIPTFGDQGLLAMLADGEPAVDLTQRLTEIVQSSRVGAFARAFTFFALISSFIGVAFGLFDFLADGLKINKNHQGRLLLSVLTFLPPALFVWAYPKGFIVALSYAGVFAAILLVIFPALMAYRGRYALKLESRYQVIGGKLGPVLGLIFGFSVILLQVLSQLDWLPKP